jgi:putative transposase
VLTLCRVMKVSRSAYYAYRIGKSCLKREKETETAKKVKAIFFENRRRYGTRRISSKLKSGAESIGRFRVRRLMKEQDLKAIYPKRFVPKTTTSDNNLASENLLKSVENKPIIPKSVIIGDITYLPLANGKFAYLSSFQDKFTRRIVGWKVSDRMTEDIVIDSLQQGIERGFISKDAIIHTDRGSQYSSRNFRKLLGKHRLRQSMSGKGNCYDNAQAESFFARYKIELLEGGFFEDVNHARSETFSYIEGYYNRTRIHSAIGNQSPADFEKAWEKQASKLNHFGVR